MAIKNYDDINIMEMDIIREIGSIGTGNAASSLSGLMGKRVAISLPEVSVLGYDAAITALGHPEKIVVGVLSQMDGEVSGIMMFLFDIEFIREILTALLNKSVESYEDLGEMEISALTEVGNIMISTYVNAMSSLAGVDINLSVPSISINMLGGLLSVPMVEMGYTTNKLLMINGQFSIGDQKYDSNMLMLPDIASLNHLMEKLVSAYE